MHSRKQFTILQLVQLSSVKSSSSFMPYNVHSSQSTLILGGRHQPATRMLSPCQGCAGLQAIARACTPTLSMLQASLSSCAKSFPVHVRLRVIDDWMNRRVLGNIEADKHYKEPDRYIHSPRRGPLSRSMWGSLRLAPIIWWESWYIDLEYVCVVWNKCLIWPRRYQQSSGSCQKHKLSFIFRP